MNAIKKQAQLSLKVVNEKADLVTNIGRLRNENARLKQGHR